MIIDQSANLGNDVTVFTGRILQKFRSIKQIM